MRSSRRWRSEPAADREPIPKSPSGTELTEELTDAGDSLRGVGVGVGVGGATGEWWRPWLIRSQSRQFILSSNIRCARATSRVPQIPEGEGAGLDRTDPGASDHPSEDQALAEWAVNRIGGR